uniref:Uncharacterized protein n=1 Tax=Lepeophtheirus salmonis TaxID=72036 RepID=A0A0K2T5N3_LEPSM
MYYFVIFSLNTFLLYTYIYIEYNFFYVKIKIITVFKFYFRADRNKASRPLNIYLVISYGQIILLRKPLHFLNMST